ncbi:MAG: glutamate--cysteine ligase [Brachymonas sp.]|nr:glutamate--cysteine ligase [Brachymonas sp.]
MTPPDTTLQTQLEALTQERLAGMRRGLEKESLRVQPNGKLALTPHPQALGSPLTHPHITTDYSESQVELVTGVHASAEDCLAELTLIHQAVYREMAALGDEMLWVCSMPCGLPTDETIPLGMYGTSNVGRAKSVYRMGLGHRYGRRMQTISGIHYNWSLPDVTSEQYFGLIRNFRRHAFLLLYLFGASPAVCGTFVEGREHGLQPFGAGAMHLPYATSLRMGRLGYKSDAQASLAVSYNSLEGYAASLYEALTVPYPAYEAIGVRNPGGDYNQLSTALLQIENEFYSTIRPKRVIQRGERPLHALRERGVQYVEVRLMDLNPFIDVGIDAVTMRFLDVFLLHALLTPSPPDTREEIETISQNQHLVASQGREPGLVLQRQGKPLALLDWSHDILNGMEAVARRLDMLGGGGDHMAAVAMGRERLQQPALLPSAQVLEGMHAHGDSYVGFGKARSLQAQQALKNLPFTAEQQARFHQMAQDSVTEQQAIEASDTMPFEEFRQQYVSVDHLSFCFKDCAHAQ